MLGTIIKNMRINADMTQKQLGDAVSLANNTISSYERGNSQPDFEILVKIAEICGYQFKIIDKNNTIISLEELSREK